MHSSTVTQSFNGLQQPASQSGKDVPPCPMCGGNHEGSWCMANWEARVSARKGKFMEKTKGSAKDYAYMLVQQYCTYDMLTRSYTVKREKVPDFDLDHLAALIMDECPDYYAEATGPDNPHFETTIQPALRAYMLDSTDKEKASELSEAYKASVRHYMSWKTWEHIYTQLEDYNSMEVCA